MKWTFMGAFCDLLIQHMEKGYSFDTFSASLKYPPDVVKEWLVTKPSFAQARKMGEVARKKFLETLLLADEIDLKTFQHLTETPESEMDTAVEQFDTDTLIQARERFSR